MAHIRICLVTDNPSYVTHWIWQTESVHARRLHRLIVGLDIEWRPTFNSNQQSQVAILQLCVDHRCLIFQLLHCHYIPTALTTFLVNPNYNFVGVGIKGDVEKLEKDYGISVKNVVDLRHLAADAYGMTDLRNAGLKKMCEVVLGKEMEKPKHITLGKWDNKWLSEDQVQYACIDAFVSFEIGKRLNASGVMLLNKVN
ncbi:werner syndrome-like exonuclease [Nicotiana attenuata]|uniref:Werner syndrome-like exonuclease n=1 Tax=Nicotiana attenuata TaxID=49451 RepID=A0A1J6KBT4_NICAT|nr:werner syndrome-like exonuclease [Nicotiana attenuata]